MKRLIFILGLLLMPLLSGIVHAQSPQDLAQKYGVTFPISELGNCTNVQTCKVYCDQRENRDACIAFAKDRGLYKETVSEKKANALAPAKGELGCTSFQSCRSFCEQEENTAKCQSFAQKHGLVTAPSVKDEQLLTKAKQNLNCDSFETCKAICDNQENYTKCAALLQDQVTSDERAMFEKYKPQIKEFLGCDSMVTCMAFCINPANSAKCSELGNKIGGSEQIPNQEPPEVWCPKISSECKWDGSNCFCDGPQSCSQSPGCSWNGQFCNCGDTPTTINESPEVWCPKAGPGCKWDGNQCACFESGTPTQTDIPPPTQEPGEIWCPKIGPYCVWDGSSCTCWDDCVKTGGTWTGSKCDLPQEQTTTQTPDQIYPTPKPGEVCGAPRNPGCTWTGTECQCASQLVPQTNEQVPPDLQAYPTNAPAIQGISTNRGLLQQLLDFILIR